MNLILNNKSISSNGKTVDAMVKEASSTFSKNNKRNQTNLLKCNFKRIVSVVMAVFLFAGSFASASDMPYNSYTYDEWGNPIESPSGYEPTMFVDGIKLGAGPFLNPTDIYASSDDMLYVLDSGNKRIVITNELFKSSSVVDHFFLDGKETSLNDPQGIFVAKDQTIYIADSANNRILVTDKTGNVSLAIGKPTTEVYPQATNFEPQKIVVDRMGTIFAICKGVYYGAVMFNQKGEFLGYFGSNKVELTADLMIARIWKGLMSKENKDKLANYIPVEFTSFDIDFENFIYSCTNFSNSNFNMVRKINPMGINILESKASKSFQGGFGDLNVVYYNNQQITTKMQDICIDEKGYITALDYTRGRIFQYDQDANILFAFGGLGIQNGMFRTPVAIENINSKICVLDKTTNGFTVFELTEFGKTVHIAMELYNDGRYLEAVDPWNQVLKYDSNFNLAYIGLGKALQETGKTQEAMRYFKIGYYRNGYNKAFNEYRNNLMRKLFPIFFVIFVLLVAYGYTKKRPFMKKITSRIRHGVDNIFKKGGDKT